MSKKILMLTCQFMPDVFGGAEKQCARVSTELVNQGYDVTILTSSQSKNKQQYILPGVKIHRIYTKIAPDLLDRWSIFSIYWLVRVIFWSFLNKNDFDIIHCHQGKFGGAVGCLIGKFLKKPVLIKIGNSEEYMDLICLKNKQVLGPPLSNLTVKSNPTFVAITKVIADNLRDFGCKNIIEISNGVVAPPRIKSNENIQETDTINLYYHGRIESIKRVDVLIKAFSHVLKETAPFSKVLRLHIFGVGSCLGEIKHLAEALDVSSSIEFHGEVDDVFTEIDKHDIFVNSSIAEGFSNSLLESLLLGKVLVSTPVSGAEEAIAHGINGFIANDFNENSLADAIAQGVDIHIKQPEAVKQYSSKLLEERFSMSIIVEKYRKLYDSMLSAS